MNIALISLFPEMFNSITDFGVIGRAVKSNLLQLHFFDPRDFTSDKYKAVDDRPFGGGPGMVMLAEPLAQAIASAKEALGDTTPVYYLSPQGKVFSQGQARDLAESPSMILLCGRYEGIDQRIIEALVDAEISIGDYVLSGGELPAMVVIDTVARLLPGVLGDAQSAVQDSFSTDSLDHPHYTRPAIWRDISVPKVLLSGNHAKIEAWRKQQAELKTRRRC